MKRITRTMRTSRHSGVEERVWLDKDGHWTRNVEHAGEFEDDDASRRVRRIPHAELESIENKSQESGNG